MLFRVRLSCGTRRDVCRFRAYQRYHAILIHMKPAFPILAWVLCHGKLCLMHKWSVVGCIWGWGTPDCFSNIVIVFLTPPPPPPLAPHTQSSDFAFCIHNIWIFLFIHQKKNCVWIHQFWDKVTPIYTYFQIFGTNQYFLSLVCLSENRNALWTTHFFIVLLILFST